MHVARFVASHECSTYICHVRSLAHGLLAHGNDSLPVLFRQQITEKFAAVGIRPFAHKHGGRVNMQRSRLIETRYTWDKIPFALARRQRTDRGNELAQMLFRCPAASPHHAHAEIPDKMRQDAGEFLRSQLVVRVSANVFGNAGIGHDKDRFGT